MYILDNYNYDTCNVNQSNMAYDGNTLGLTLDPASIGVTMLSTSLIPPWLKKLLPKAITKPMQPPAIF